MRGDDCANARFDEVSFEAKVRQGVLLYKGKNCTLRVVVRKGGADVAQNGHCSDYDLLAGIYAKRASEVWEDDCSTSGGPGTRHE